MLKSAGLLLFALILDIAQAGVSAGLLAIASLGGAVGMPLGLALGFAVNICLSLMFGTLLMALMWLAGLRYPWFLFSGFMTEIIPGVGNLPGWTLLVLGALWKDVRKKKSVSAGKGVLRLAQAALPGAQMVMNLKNSNMDRAARAGFAHPEQGTQTPLPRGGKDLVRIALNRHAFDDIKPYTASTHAKTA